MFDIIKWSLKPLEGLQTFNGFKSFSADAGNLHCSPSPGHSAERRASLSSSLSPPPMDLTGENCQMAHCAGHTGGRST